MWEGAAQGVVLGGEDHRKLSEAGSKNITAQSRDEGRTRENIFSFCLHSFPASRSFNELALCIQVAKVLEYIVICFYSKSNELYHAVWCLII